MTELGSPYYAKLSREYEERRAVLVPALKEAGFDCRPPEGAYYVLADFSGLSGLDDTAFSRLLTREAGVTPVPGSSFYSEPERGRNLVRFAFCKRLETLERAAERLRRFGGAGG
jgi:aminotransferase